MRHKYAALVLAFLIFGVVNSRNTCHGADSGWSCKTTLGFNLARGNSETALLDFGISAKKGNKPWQVDANAGITYGETGGEATEQNAHAEFQARLLLSAATYVYGSCRLDHDSIAGINYRLLAGPGIGHHLVKNDNYSLCFELGASYVEEDIAAAGATRSIALRAAQRCEYKFGENARMWESVEFVPEIDDFGSCLLRAELGIETQINALFSLRTSILDRYDSVPAPGTGSNDLMLRVALACSIGP
jgi:putative salt-induced outer membrane protein